MKGDHFDEEKHGEELLKPIEECSRGSGVKNDFSNEEKDLLEAKAQLTRAQTFEIYREA